jgi:UDP:flavonoid glycosyltransferase YjiC (YdhE family)
MRILFTPLAWRSHYFPMVVLAWACRAAGHEVRVAAQPGVLDAVHGSGMPAVVVGKDYDFMAGIAEVEKATLAAQQGRPPLGIDDLRKLPPEVLRMVRAGRLVPHTESARAIAPDLLSFAEVWTPDVIVSDPAHLAAPLLAETRGIPLVRHMWGPDISRLAGFPGLGLPGEEWPEPLADLYRQYGVAPREDFAAVTVDPVPPSLQVPGLPNRVPGRYVPYNGPGQLPEWLAVKADRPRICVAWTTTARETEGEGLQLRDMVAGLSDLDVEIVLVIGKDPEIRLPQDAKATLTVACNVPLNLIMPACSAIMHHGGAGTLMTAAYYGVPQVVAGQLLDWTYNAEQLASTGAGIAPKAEEANDASALAAHVARLLTDDSWLTAARRLADQMSSQPSPADTVAVLEDLA